MSKKLTIEFVREQFKKEGYTLLTKKYKCCDQPLWYVCPNKHKHYVSWSNWNHKTNKRRCPYCLGFFRKTIEYIKKEFKKENYILLTKKYTECYQKLDYICPNGHRHKIVWNKWQSGRRCPYCKEYFCGSNIRLSFEYVKCELKKRNYILLSTKYNGAHVKLKCKCNKGHLFYISWGNFKHNKRGCPICDGLNRSGETHYNWKGGISKEPYCQDWTKDLKEYIKERDGYRCMNPYCFKKKGNAAKLSVHHINYNKKSCGPENLVTVCNSCNAFANKDRDWHQEWYQTILSKKYGYSYE